MKNGTKVRGQTTHQIDEVDPKLVEEFLFKAAGTGSKVTRWKYFDESFNKAHNRGYAALQEGQITGFIGLIPFRASADSTDFDAAWTCDWYSDVERANSITGISLLKRAASAYRSLFHVGGNENTKRVFSRLATFTDADGVLEFRLDLRLGCFSRRLRVRKQVFRRLPLDLFARVPLTRIRKSDHGVPVICQEGIAPKFEEVLAAQQCESSYHPMYDASYVQWQVGRCPQLHSFTCFTNSGAAALVWRGDNPRSEYRMALVWTKQAFPDLNGLIRETIRYVYDCGADEIRIRMSRHDRRVCALLFNCGLRERYSLPFYAIHQTPEDMPKGGMSGLSFLDVDEARRFFI